MTRYTDAELEALLDDTESDLAERKESFTGDVPSKARQAVCAFANDLPNRNVPGVLFIGAKDNGSPSDCPITDQLLLTLSSMKSDGNIMPMPAMTVEKRRYKNLPFDLYPVPTATLGDLSKTIFLNEYLPAAFAPDVLEENHRTYQERLASSKMIVSLDDPTPTVLGLLAIGKSPQDLLDGAYIQFLRIDGLELADPVVDEEAIGGSLSDMLRRTEEKLRSHNRSALDAVSAATHSQDSPYPQAAIQQLLYNAALHRTYESTHAPIRVYWFNDRIEIHSPGGPFGNVTAENFGQPGITDYRNPNIGDVLKTFGYIQAFGRGIAIARRELEKNGNPPPEFVVTPSAIVCTLRKKS